MRAGIDMNGKIAALLRDFAAVQKSKQSMWGYKRAAHERRPLVAPHHERLGTLRAVAQHDHGRRRARVRGERVGARHNAILVEPAGATPGWRRAPRLRTRK